MISGLSLLPTCAVDIQFASTFVHFVVATVVRSKSGLRDSIMHRHAVEYSTYPRGSRSGPGCSVPVRHHLIGIRPLAGTSRFHRIATYTRCLRCAGAPRRPASGSELSLHIPSWHAVLSDPGESNIDMFQNFDADMAFAV